MGFLNWLNPISSGISAVSNIFASAGNRKSHEAMNNANIAATERINAENRQFSKDMWNMTNEYNSPAICVINLNSNSINCILVSIS